MAGKLAGASRGKGMAPNSEPNVIPFIDIMLVMLIIFMVAAPMPTVDVKVDLPPPGIPIYTQPEDKPTIVSIQDEAGVLTLYIGDEIVPQERFRDRLFEIVRTNNTTMRDDLAKLFKDAKVFVDADQETNYANVIGLINEIDQTGFKQVSLLVKDAAI
ncbi:MAG: biopolymer transporter ExbD [Hyphomonadaceae bacterium]|nr:biopolymer transporter ExbD [Hyphomonadaceae bacterium]